MRDQPPANPQGVANRGVMIVGALLMAMGALLSMAGAAIGLTAAVSSLRQYVRGTGLPPSELAMHHWRRVKTAGSVGADSWRGNVPTQRAAPRSSARTPTG